MTCQHERRLPNPAGGAWFCADCGHYPLISGTAPSMLECAVILQRAWKALDEAKSEARYLRAIMDAASQPSVMDGPCDKCGGTGYYVAPRPADNGTAEP